MPKDYTGENLQDALITSFTIWGMDPTKVVAITTDSGSNISLACKLFGCVASVSCLAINKDLRDS